MNMRCPLCGEEIQLPEEVQEGQHILCPYCEQKFSYQIDDSALQEQESIANSGVVEPKFPKGLRILSKILLVIGAWIAICAAKDWMWPDGFNHKMFLLFVMGLLFVATAYFFEIGHGAARKTAFMAIFCAFPDTMECARHFENWLGIPIVAIPFAATYLPAARRWLTQYTSLNRRDLHVALQVWRGLSKVWKCVVVIVFACVIYNLATPSTVGWNYGEFEGARGLQRYVIVYSIATYDESCLKITAIQRDSCVTVAVDKDWDRMYRGVDWVFNFDDDAGWKKCKALIREKVRDRAAKQVIARLEKLRREL